MNQELGVILRIARGSNVRKMQKEIEMRINSTINTTAGYPPKEVFLLTSILKNYKKPTYIYIYILIKIKLLQELRNMHKITQIN